MSKKIRLLISVVLLSWLALITDWPRVGRDFAQMRVEFWLAAVGVLIVTQLVSAVRWQALARPYGFERRLPQMAGFYFVGMYFNLVLPTSVGGDVVRAWYLDGGGGHRLRALFTVFLDRLCGLWILLALAFCGVLFSPLPLPAWIRWSVFGCAAAGLLGSIAMPLIGKYFKSVPRKLNRLFHALRSLPPLRALLWPVLLSIVVQTANVLIVWLIGEAVGAPIPPSYFWVLVPMVSLLTMLPISVNGMGVREGTTILLLAPLQIARETALTLAFLWFAVYVTVGLLGGLVYQFGHFPRPVLTTSNEGRTEDGSVDSDTDQGREGQRDAIARQIASNPRPSESEL